MGLGSGLVNLFKYWGKGIGKAADNFWLGADARKAITEEVEKKFKPKIDIARRAERRKANNIKDLDTKLTESKKALQDAKKTWQDRYDAALADAKNQRQTEISDYDTKLKAYQDAVNNAKQGRQSIIGQLYDSEANYNPLKTIFTDVTTGENYIVDLFKGGYKSLNSLPKKKQKVFENNYADFDNRLFDSSSGKVINAFDDSDFNKYGGKDTFDNYLNRVRAPKEIDLRDADNQIKQAKSDLSNWQSSRPNAWDDNVDLDQFKKNFENSNGVEPNKYSFNGKNYSNKANLGKAYKKALAHEQTRQDLASRAASRYASKRDAEIAKRIQDAKDMNKAKLALGAGVGAGALFAGAKAMYGSDDTDNSETPDNIDNTDNTYTGEPDPDFNVKKEGKAILKDRQQIYTSFDPDKAEAKAVLAGAAYDKGVEDGNSVRSSGDSGNNIGATTRGHTMDDRLYELIKAMKDPYKADAIANYIYSRHGDDPEVQRLGWRGWLNKYYGDSLRSIMNIDPSGYKGMHISGGL